MPSRAPSPVCVTIRAPDPAFRQARTTVVLGAGESKEVRIRCVFEPERVVVDPDGYVLQLQRKAALAKL